METNQHTKTVLAGERGCRVVYCVECGVAEIEVGSVSLRLNEEGFRQLRRLMNDAAETLEGAVPSHYAEIRHVH